MKRVLQDFVIDKIAAVDRPCQEHATVTIMKRALPEDQVEKIDILDRVTAAKRAAAQLQIDLMKANIGKAWSDKARQASIEARRHNAMATKHFKTGGDPDDYRGGDAPDYAPKNMWRHYEAQQEHGAAADRYESAVNHYKSGKTGLGDRAMASARKIGAKAYSRSAKLGIKRLKKAVAEDLAELQGKVEKAWSDEARRASIAARQGHFHAKLKSTFRGVRKMPMKTVANMKEANDLSMHHFIPNAHPDDLWRAQSIVGKHGTVEDLGSGGTLGRHDFGITYKSTPFKLKKVWSDVADLQDNIEKAWSDKARQASLEARRRSSVHAEKGDRAKAAGDTSAWMQHRTASGLFRQSHEAYESGDHKGGSKFFRAGVKQGDKANRKT